MKKLLLFLAVIFCLSVLYSCTPQALNNQEVVSPGSEGGNLPD